jgi:glycosyltransferase involved in cell wall biosynthesis
VFAAGGSDVEGKLVATLPGPYAKTGAPDDWQLCEWINLCHAVRDAEAFDVLHSHAYLWGLPLQPLCPRPMVHTMHVTPYADQLKLRQMFPDAVVTAISKAQWSSFPQLPPVPCIPHGVDADQFTFRQTPDDYVCFLGRFIPGKGPVQAIEAARAAGLPIRLAGPANDYFRDAIEPLVDGKSVQYVGSVAGEQRDQLLGGARALVYPVQAPEPFGLVLVEAMMCGTPVAAIDLGAVSEVVDESVTGVSVKPDGDFVGAIRRAVQLDRRGVRTRAEERFSSMQMARRYVEVYEQAVASRRGGVGAGCLLRETLT